MEAEQQNLPFIKNLASSDRKTRTSALTSLRAFLSARQNATALSPVDVLKLWKGLFYALWMCDRPIPQQALCSELADLINVLPPEAVVPWLRGFWATMAREWVGIDVLRLDKFLLLVRRVLGAALVWMKAQTPASERGATPVVDGTRKRKKKLSRGNRWDPERVDGIIGLLGEWPFSVDVEDARAGETDEQGKSSGEKKIVPRDVPSGLRLHVLDIWVDEAEKAGLLGDDEADGDGSDDPEAQRILQRITELVDNLEKGTLSKAVRLRSKQSLLDPRLPWNSIAGEEEDSDE
ncbi:hypothetical protein VTK73DRAFT_6680 [Phialemonium thermophilum]|uniref:Ribosomal RNA-processing protein 1 n=1 Tax=Phialemonium thermophilum TaxID=223376 RepID=A0ABR3WIS3_9PEZI